MEGLGVQALDAKGCGIKVSFSILTAFSKILKKNGATGE